MASFVVVGIGNGMMAMIVFLVSDQYFIKWKAMAVAIIASGAGLGTITLPYIMRALYDNYDFAGASLLYGMLPILYLHELVNNSMLFAIFIQSCIEVGRMSPFI